MAASLRPESQVIPGSAPEARPQDSTPPLHPMMELPSQPMPATDPVTAKTVEHLLCEQADLVHQLEASHLETEHARASSGARQAATGDPEQSREDLLVDLIISQQT